MNDKADVKLQKKDDDPSNNNEGSLPIEPAVESQIEEIIEGVPDEEKAIVRSSIEKLFVGLIERSATSRINPEVAKILADSQDKDNEHKFQISYPETKR